MSYTSLLVTCILKFVAVGQCAVKIWQPNTDIYDNRHWLNNKLQDDCQGFIFPSNVEGLILIDGLKAKNIVLPREGHLLLTDDAEIVLGESSDKMSLIDMNCVQLNESHFYGYEWSEIGNWITDGKENNEAVPHKERPPCEYDDVILPEGILSGTLYLPYYKTKMKSFKFGDEYWTNDDIRQYSTSHNLPYIFLTSVPLEEHITIQADKCQDPTGCVCGNSGPNEEACYYTPYVSSFQCTDPILPIGFCSEICGATIILEPNRNFKLAEMEETLKNYNSDTYVSKVTTFSNDEVIQIIFTEKQFTGTSLDEAMDLFQNILKSPEVMNPVLQLSGPYYKEGEGAKSAMSLIFGTLCGVILVFALLYIAYSPRTSEGMLGNRFSFISRPLSTYSSNLSARYDASEGTGLIFEGQSMAGSVLSLDKSFENPMYGKSTPSTSSTSNDTIGFGETKSAKTELAIENPMFDIQEKIEEMKNITEEGELVDLNNTDL